MKEIFALGGVAAIVIAVLYVLGRRKEAITIGATPEDSSTSPCLSLSSFINTVEEGLDMAVPAIEGQGTGSFSGWRVNATGYQDSPNVISETGAAIRAATPDLHHSAISSIMATSDLKRAALY